ncbi:MAG: squalene/phytoene synthase family protein [Verrucomicrobia bacterium]|nr:squalene/phytoene synthase family protein [Verrucomicrobiota bacterium]
MSANATPLLEDLLKDVSRSFYLTLRVLPSAIRPQIGLAYLLARAADTIADTDIIPVVGRLSALQGFRKILVGSESGEFRADEFIAAHQVSAAERLLLRRIDEALQALERFDSTDQRLIRDVLQTITSGQELDLQRFAYASSNCVIPLKTDAELDDYTFRVAGCVGEFWTRMCRRHIFPADSIDAADLIANGIRFGKGLQLINILRDLPADLRRGRCYLPQAQLSEMDLKPQEMLAPESENRLRPLYDDYLDRAEAHLAAGWYYTNTLPRRAVRVRLACAWPILIGRKTLAKLRSGRILDPARPIKIRRQEVWSLVARSVVTYPFARVWRRLYHSGGT